MAVLKIKNSSGQWQDIAALQGERGERGEVGPAPDITIEAVALPAGTDPEVVKSGSNENPTFTFKIPRGADGTVPDDVVKTVNGVAPTNGNVAITSVTSATKATQDGNGKNIANTYAAKSGSRGTLAGYNTPASTSAAVTISQTSNDDTIVTSAVAIKVSNGSANTAWVKNVAIKNASATVTLNSAWQWVGGSAPTITANSILVLCWMGTFGLANLVSSS